MTDKHTPGPWVTHKRNDENISTLVRDQDGDYLIADCAIMWRGENNNANARLIAAAPDMLAALERLVGWFDDGDDGQLIMEARAAIAKARGNV